jgi:hypothetical protein
MIAEPSHARLRRCSCVNEFISNQVRGANGNARAARSSCDVDVHARDLGQLLADRPLRRFDIETVLQIKPELCGGAERLAQAQRGVGGDPARLGGDAFNPRAAPLITKVFRSVSAGDRRPARFLRSGNAGIAGKAGDANSCLLQFNGEIATRH